MYTLINVTLGKMEMFKKLSAAIEHAEHTKGKYEIPFHYQIYDMNGTLVEEIKEDETEEEESG